MLPEIQLPSSLSEFVFSRLIQDISSIHCEVSGVIENADIEFVHRIRIAIRRYRNNLKIFRYFADQSFYDFLSLKYLETDEFSSLLALARDLDIQGYLLNQGLELPYSAAKTDFLHVLEEERVNIQRQLIGYINSSSYTVLMKHMDDLNNVNAIHSIKPFNDSKVFDAVCSSFAFALSIMYPISENTDGEEVHRFRKAIRRVRYTMESFQPVISYPIESIIEESHLIQDLLGDMHDLDMLCQSLRNTEIFQQSQSKELLEIMTEKHLLLHEQFVEKLNMKEIHHFLFNQLNLFSKEQNTIWK